MGAVSSVISNLNWRRVQVALPAVARASVLAAAVLAARADCDIHTWLARIPRGYYKGKICWVTGASSGIGRALCVELAKRGAELMISARSEDTLLQIRDELMQLGAASVTVVPVDLTAGDEVIEKAVETALAAHGGKLDILVNNAGVSTRAAAVNLELEHVRRLFEINVFAPYALARLCLPALESAASGGGGGGIVINTSSIASVVPTPLRSSYTASKAALDRYFTAFSYENPRVHVLSLCPGSTYTNVSVNAVAASGATWGKMDEAIRNGLSADRVAERALAAAASRCSVSWIAKPKELLGTRLAFFAPSLWSVIAPIQFRGYAQRLAETAQPQGQGQDERTKVE